MKKVFIMLLAMALMLCACGRITEFDMPEPSYTVEFSALEPRLDPTPSPIAPTQEPTPEPTLEPTPTPEPTIAPEPSPLGVLLKSRVNEVYVRSSPDKTSKNNVMCSLGFEEKVWGLEEDGEFTHVNLEDGREGYVYTDFLVGADEVLYASVPKEKEIALDEHGNIIYEANGKPKYLVNELVDIRLYCPDVEIDLIFAGSDNIFGEPVYGKAVALLQRETAKKLQKAAELFAKDGYKIKVYDAYRPVSVSRRLYKTVKNASLAANPDSKPSNHNRGAAVDISLIGPDGQEVEMPTPMHTFNDEPSRKNSANWSEEAKKNSDYMTKIMKQAGFTTIQSEWWHFADKDKAKYMVSDINVARLTMVTKDML